MEEGLREPAEVGRASCDSLDEHASYHRVLRYLVSMFAFASSLERTMKCRRQKGEPRARYTMQAGCGESA